MTHFVNKWRFSKIHRAFGGNMTVWRALAIALTFACSNEVSAQAFDVKIPDAEAGALSFGVLQSFQSGLPAALGSDVNRRTHQFEIEYGIFDWWKVTACCRLGNRQVKITS